MRMPCMIVGAIAIAGCDHGAAAQFPDAAHADGATPDAPAAPTGTLCGGSVPTSAPATITVSGTAVAYDGTQTTTAGLTVAVLVGSTTLASGGVDSSLAFSLTVPTGGVPIDFRVHVSAPGYADTDFYPAGPVAADYAVDTRLLVVSPSLFAMQGGGGQDTSHAFVLARPMACASPPQQVEGVTVALVPAGSATETYFDRGTLVPAPTATTTEALFRNTDPGGATVTASSGTTVFRDRPIDAPADTHVTVELQPR
jgi:hypothetical protein